MAVYEGGCHCGNVRLAFETATPPDKVDIRACQCSFCRKHNSLATADPDGMLTIRVKDDRQLRHYTFGLKTAEYLVCRDCGVYVAAVTADDNAPKAIVIVNALDERSRFNREPRPTVYDAETREERMVRRRTGWTPVRWGD